MTGLDFEVSAGEPGAVKAASPVRRGAVGKGPLARHLAGRLPYRKRTPPLVRLKAVCGPGDHGEPVVTVMLPAED